MTTPITPSPSKPPRDAVAVTVGLAIVAVAKWLGWVARQIAGTAGRDAADRVAAAEASGHVPRYRIYTATSLGESLTAFEQRFGIASAEFMQLYERGAIPSGVPRHSANAWAMVWEEAERLRARRASDELFANAVALPD